MATAEKLREQFDHRQKEVAAYYEKAKSEGGSYDFDLVEVEGCKTTEEKIDRLNKFQDELSKMFDTWKKADELEQKINKQNEHLREPQRPALPGSGGGESKGGKREVKALHEQLVESKALKAFRENQQIGIISQLDWGVAELKALRYLSAYEMKTLFERGAGWAAENIRLPGMVEATTRPVQLLDIIPSGTTNNSSIKYMEETTRTHNSAERAEGTAYAESVFALTERSQSVEKVTDSVPVTDEQLEDVAQSESYLTERLQFGLRQRLDTQCAVGDGVSPNIKGITSHSIQTQAKGSDPVPDAFYKAMTKVRFTGRAMPTNILMHPNDWQEVRLLRTADGVYIWGNPSEAGPERMWGLPVIMNEALTEGTGLVGSFLPPWIMLFNKRGIDVQVGFINDQFTKGIRTIRADLRAALVVFRAAAFASVTGI